MATGTKPAKPKKPKAKKVRQLRGGLDAGPPRAEVIEKSAAERYADQLAEAVASCPSGTWATDVGEGRVDWPIPGMVLSKCCVLTGDAEMTCNNRGERGTQRHTAPAYGPMSGVRLEDYLDGMSIAEAERYQHPSAICYEQLPKDHRDNWQPRPEEYSGPTLRGVRIGEYPRIRAFTGRWEARCRISHPRYGRAKMRVVGFAECFAFPENTPIQAIPEGM
jgi:hypothetical protein